MDKIKTLLLLTLFGLFNSLNAQKIACGTHHSLAVCADSTVWAWGTNSFGQLGDGTTDSSSIPTQVQGLSNIVSVSCGRHNSFAIDANGDVWAWGYNDFYALGLDTIGHIYTPRKVLGITKVKTILSDGQSANGIGGAASTYAITEDGSLWAWGYKFPLLAGSSDFYLSEIPFKDTVLKNVADVGGGMECKSCIA